VGDEEAFKPWPLKWEDRHIRRFWDWYASRDASLKAYFSRMAGRAVLAKTIRCARLASPVVDAGAAAGFFVEHLLRRGLDTLAVDLSPDSIALIREKFAGHPRFLGAEVGSVARLPLADKSVGTVFLLETIEHLTDAALEQVFHEARRVLRPGGYLVITTPNEEALEAQHVMCPSCGCEFHPVQHVRSWSATTLSVALGQSGFRTVRCKATLFSDLPRALWGLHAASARLRHGRLPNLLYVGYRLE
jgi:SAM-dependent methyltransferase